MGSSDDELRDRLSDGGVRQRHLGAALADFTIKIPQLGDGYFIQGGTGRGKTHLAAAAARSYLAETEQRTVVFRFAREIMRRIRQTYGPLATEQESDVLSILGCASLLVIDDLGKESGDEASAFVLSALHEILSRRLDAIMPTIVTSELSVVQVERRYGAAIASRIGSFTLVLLDGPDWRFKGRGA